MKNIFLLALLISTAFASDYQNWYLLNLKFQPIAGWTPHYYMDYAAVDEDNANMVYSLRFRRDVANGFSTGLNYSQFHKYQSSPMHRLENAWFYNYSLGKFKLSHRSRIERRINEGSSEPLSATQDWRYRLSLGLNYKLPAGFGIGMSNEAMWYSISQSWNPFNDTWEFKQNRLDPVKVSYKVNDHLILGLFYRIKTTGIHDVAEIIGINDEYHELTTVHYIGLSFKANL